jgi:flagellar hook-associated protein 3 FlgL
MTRVTESQLARNNLLHISQNREAVAKYSNEVDTGFKVTKPSDSDQSGIVAQYQGALQRIDSYRNRTAAVKSFLGFQEEALSQVSDLINRAKEIAAQAGNETNGVTARAQLSEEAFQIRDHLVQIANSKYQGKYVWGGADDDDPPYDAATYTTPASGAAAQRWVFDAESGTNVTRAVNVTEDLSITTNTPANGVFDNAVFALERLGRALAGYETLPASGTPTGAGSAYTFPAQFSAQTAAIRDSMDLLETARATNIEPERVSIAARQRRLDTAESLLTLTKSNAEQVLDKLQNADIIESASFLQQAQTTLQAALSVSARVLNQSIVDLL